VEALFKKVPSGVGENARLKLTRGETKDVFAQGARWAISKGYGWEEDLAHTEQQGFMAGAKPDQVSERAITRGAPQVGSLGGGNHFLEIQVVDEIFDPLAARTFGLRHGQVCIMIHCGSRGAGHQICTDHVERMEKAAEHYKVPSQAARRKITGARCARQRTSRGPTGNSSRTGRARHSRRS
jgi:tRNA-splicing ligase RtcB